MLPSTPQLSRTECNALRGLAIIGIFLHNYCHWLGPVVKENEYQYFQHNVDWLSQVLAAPDWLLPMHLVSFFGHYGVPVFLFLSAYGLVLKYEGSYRGKRKEERGKRNDSQTKIYSINENNDTEINEKVMAEENSSKSSRSLSSLLSPLSSITDFVVYHYLKLLKMMIVGFVAFTMLDFITPGTHHYAALDIVAMLGMFNNLLPNPDHIIWPGPYWFFGLMLQLYIVYRLLLYRRHWAFTAVLMVVCMAVQLCLGPESETLNRYRYNFMGGMLPFGLGLLYARYGERILMTMHHNVANLCAVFFCLVFIWQLSGSVLGWTLVPAFVCLLSVLVAKLLTGVSFLSPLLGFLEWMGTISAALFVCHPLTRKIFIPLSRHGDMYAGLLLYIVSSLCVAWLFMQLMKKIPNPRLR